MSKNLLFLTLLLTPCLSVFTQTTQDTVSNPYWIEMMQNPNVNFYQTQRAFNLYWGNKPIEKGSGWKAFKRWEWLSSKLIDSLGNFPDAGLQLGDYEDRIIKDKRYWDIVMPGLGPGTVPCKTQGDWKSMGPNQIPTNNTGQINGMGRVNAIALHPNDTNIIFVGAAAGGIWKSVDGGLNWSVNTDSLPTLGVSAIAINPSNPNVMYFGSGDRDANDASGFGVFKSTNAGASWAISNSGMGNRTVGRLIIDPSNPNILLAACNGGIYRSTNAGSSWTQTYSGGFFKDIIFKPNNSQVVYATYNGLIYRSVNNGVNWSAISNGLPTTSVSRAVLEVNSLDPDLLYVWIGNGSVHRGFYLSRDSGSSFRTQSTSPNIHDYSTTGSGSGGQAWYNMDMISDPGNAGIIYCGGVNIFKSTDTGKTWVIAGYWVNQLHADQHELATSPITGRIYAGNDGGLYASRNKGAPWVPLKSGLGIAQIYNLDASRTTKDILINGYQDNGTANYNAGWYTTRGGDGMDCEIDQTDHRYSYGELYYGNVFRIFNVNMQSTIAQQGYTAAGSDTINESGAWVTPITLKEGSGTTMYIGYKNIWRSNNIRSNPVTWKKISNNLGGTNSVNFTETESCIANPDIFYASRSNGTFFRSDNVNANTPSWTTVTQPVSGTINAIETDPDNQNKVYIGIGNRVYLSANKGGSWTQVATNMSYNVMSILLDTSNKKKGIYVGTMGGGIWYTDTTLSTWRYFSKGLPHTVRVTDIALYYEPTPECHCNMLYVSTYNRGTWASTIYNDGTQKPVAKLDQFDTVICKNSQITFSGKSCHNPGRFKWQFSPSGANFINGSDSMSENPSLSFSSTGVYNFKFMAENCNGTDTMEGFVIIGDTLQPSCTPTTNNNVSGLGIFQVNMGGMSRTSSGRNPEGAYVDLSCSRVIKVKKGQTYRLNVSTGTTYTEQVKAFIDYNNNGSLSDAGELVYQPAAALASHSDTFTIPMNAQSGTILRMRIRSDYLSIGSNPCSNLNYGQTEDYGLYIENENTEPKFVVNQDTVCQASAVLFTDSSTGLVSNYNWNFGAGASPASATGKGPHWVKYSSNGFKKVSLTTDGKTYTKDSAVFVLAGPEINITFDQGDSSLCLSAPVRFKVNDINSSSSTYQWRKNNLNLLDSVFQYLRFSATQLSDSGLYSVVASNGKCADTAYKKLYIRPKPLSNFNITDSLQCVNGNLFSFVNASSISVGTYSNYWQFGDGNKDSGLSMSHSYANTGIFNVKLISKSNFNCYDSIQKTVRVLENPQASFSVSNAAQCYKNNSFSFTNTSSINSGSFTSSWNFGNGVTSSANNPIGISYNAFDTAYTIRLSLTSNLGCRDSSSQKIYLYHQPTATFSVNDSTQCLKGNWFQFANSSSIGAGSITNNWLFGDGAGSNIAQPNKSYLNPGTYTVRLIVTSNRACTDTARHQVEVFHQPTAQFTINDSTQCFRGHVVQFINKSFIPSGNISVNWDFGDATGSGADSITHLYSSAGSYSVQLVATSNNSCQDTLTKPVLIHPQTLPAFTVNQAQQCFNGHAFNISNTSSISSGTYSSSWQFGDGSSSTLNQPPVKKYANFADSFQISLYCNSDQNCKDTVTDFVYLFASPLADFSINDSTACLRNNAFAFTNAGSIVRGSFNSFWTFGDGFNANTLNANHVYLNHNTFTVELILSSDKNCNDSLSKKVHVFPQTQVSFSVNPSVQCFKDNGFNFTNTSQIAQGSFNSFWDFGDGTNSNQTQPPLKNYSFFQDSFQVELICLSSQNCRDTGINWIYLEPSPSASFIPSDTVACAKGNTFTFTNTGSSNSGNFISMWRFGDGSADSAVHPSHTYTQAGIYRVQLNLKTTEQCRDSASRVIHVNPSPNADFTINLDSQCLRGNKISLNDISQIDSGTWSANWKLGDGQVANGPLVQHSYGLAGSYQVQLIVNSALNCADTATKPINIFAHPQAGFIINDSLQCLKGNQFILTDLSISNSTYTRIWRIPQQQTSADSIYTSSFSDSGQFQLTLIVQNKQTCADSISKRIYVAPMPEFSVFGRSEVCQLDTLSLWAQSSQNLTYSWLSNGTGASSTNPYSVSTQLTGSKNITIKASNKYACETGDTLVNRVVVHAFPLVRFTIDSDLIGNSLKLVFKDTGSYTVLSRNWIFSNGQTGNQAEEILYLEDTATLHIRLSVTDQNGCKGFYEKSQFYTLPNHYFIPSGFSPDGNGLNDEFKLEGYINLKSFSMKVYSRWGELIFQSNDPDKGWDGKYANAYVAPGYYLYLIEIEALDGELIERKGMLMLVR